MDDSRLHRATIGQPQNFWLYSSRTGFDLTHPPDPDRPSEDVCLTLNTRDSPVSLSVKKTALVIIDMQNFFLSPALGRTAGPGHAACQQLIDHAIPAARKAGIQIIWLNWGLTETELQEMPPAIKRAFGFQAVQVDEGDPGATAKWLPGVGDPFAEMDGSTAVDKIGAPRQKNEHEVVVAGKQPRIYKGLGSHCGTLRLPNGEIVDAGRLLMRDSWNAALYPPLDSIYDEGLGAAVPDVWIHKNRMSGMWGASTDLQDFLDERDLRTLMFTGVNTDQCVSGTLTDAFSKGYDCILLADGAGTTSPHYAQECIEYNAARTYGFVSDCRSLSQAVAGLHAERDRT